MLKAVGYSSIEDFLWSVVPSRIRIQQELDIGRGLSEDRVSQRAAQDRLSKRKFGAPTSEWVIPTASRPA